MKEIQRAQTHEPPHKTFLQGHAVMKALMPVIATVCTVKDLLKPLRGLQVPLSSRFYIRP